MLRQLMPAASSWLASVDTVSQIHLIQESTDGVTAVPVSEEVRKSR